MKRKQYDRPHDLWQCGSAGDPCSTGPTCGGRCPALGECAPIRDGDRWVCNRSDGRGGTCDKGACGGGPCEGGPSPDGACGQIKQCKPRRSLRAIRGRWLRGAAVFTVGAVLMLLGAAARNDLLAPGSLSTPHAQVLARAEGTNRCATCHPGAGDGPAAWLAMAWHGGGEAHGLTQSALCLECHKEMASPGREPMLAHGLSPAVLKRGASTQVALAAAAIVGLPPMATPAHGMSAGDPLACAACHQEHHGAKHDLKAITDARCQACHAAQFHSFAAGHPDFGAWPVSRRARIAFNHASHSGKHYATANRTFDCRSCHLEDAAGDLTLRADYHAGCAECHDADITKSFGDGVTVLALPTIDPAAFSAASIDAGRWPERATGDFDGDLPAFTRLLLAADPAASEAMKSLGADFSFFDVDPSDDQQVAAAATLVAALKRLLAETQEEGHAAIAYRLRSLVGDAARPDADYLGHLPVELIDRIQATWLGDAAPPEEFDAVEDRRSGGGWTVDDERLALLYRPTGHDDPLMRAWLDAIVALPAEHSAVRDACLAEFRRPGAPGRCFECHSIDQTPTGLAINWRGRQRLSEPRGFTHFSHRPHLVQPELADCTHCHRIDPSGDPQSAYASFDPSRPASEFAALSKSACVQCHQPKAAGDSCTQCHNYHVQ